VAGKAKMHELGRVQVENVRERPPERPASGPELTPHGLDRLPKNREKHA